MKKLFTVISFLIISITVTEAQYIWRELTYHYQTGSVAPPYFYKYDLTIDNSGKGALVYYPGYSEDSVWRYDLQLSSESLKELQEVISSSTVLTDSIEALEPDKTPIGGSLQNLIIILTDTSSANLLTKTITTPYFPKKKKYRESLPQLYDKIKSFVPSEFWTELQTKKEQYIKENEGK